MSENYNNNNSQGDIEDSLDLQELLLSILRNWYWILIFVIIGFFGARLYLRYALPIFKASGKVLIKNIETNSGTGLTEEAVLQEFGLFKPGNNINNEIQILRSRTLMLTVMEQLGLDVQYTGLGRLKNTEYYGGNSPIVLDSIHWFDEEHNLEFEVEPIDNEAFRLIDKNEEESVHKFNTPIIIKSDTIWLDRNTDYINSHSRMKIKSGIGASKYLQELQIRPAADYASVLILEIEDPVRKRASDIINKLIEVYNQAAIDDKNQVAEKTLKFIDERLGLLTQELNSVEGGLESYKERNEISTEASTTVNFILNEISQYDNELTKQRINLELLETIEQTLTGNVERYEIIPVNMGVDNAGNLEAQITNYNSTIIDRERLSRSAGEGNSQLEMLNIQLNTMRNTILESTRALQENLNLKINETQGKISQLQNRINQVPRQERELLEIKRQQNIKEALYLFLLQKKEETALSAAITVPNARVIDAAITSGVPVSPKPIQIYAIFVMLGFALPVGIIFLKELLDDKIYSENDIEKLTSIPILGALTRNNTGQNVVVRKNSRTAISEMFRLLRTNLNYMLSKEGGKTILVTSGMGGDGKTFISMNLGMSLALTGKKVVLVGMDLRKPKLTKYLNNQSDAEKIGLTNFLIGEHSLDNIVYPTDVDENLFIIPSGPIPPNPAELLDEEKLAPLFEYLRSNFDYIIIDTAPIGLVADAFLLEPFSHVALFAVRYAKTTEDAIRSLNQLQKENKLKNLAIVLNGVKKKRKNGYGYSYGYGYGYGYYSDDKSKKKWWFK
ncbi:GumC family protein [Flavilitoribacter nigricans]|uniref:non-specific protein-tyrosine kinase n=1 Tax=Flavilitoribacter nigricans (strain ATCC 23147 / DSM 23189 / NBRC 102662 / NCIMB 1420 / SS-2) TaxID=1122177 RepID=A0A2D0MZG4_FLAN2|nr:polysaccharide biosynthesis tyrosine autokinase [Flavilitoribacter nigricans]PHN01506.1 capsular biosynthesis protein [Flavilitoribacter nigricans DSM 23189 = NBRC 102662]